MISMSDDFLEFYINTHPAPQAMPDRMPKIDVKRLDIKRCEFCNKPLPKKFKVHVNICQEPTKHRFCSRECKESWCYGFMN
ncbi:MAG: hypothetical protein DRG27_04040 [Deltaproteobacteria bacterium]|nr:MAG: hypothetical protein DRG27_04040 [Deltaproteobacteria bacterium]